MEKWMIVYLLPLEVWMDIFCFPWITRKEFGQLVARIGNFKFAEHAQFYLHEWGKQKLGKLYFKQGGLYKYGHGKRYRLEYPQTAMPENIKSFSSIGISHFDANTLDFLTKITPLLTDLEIELRSDRAHLENMRTILAIMSPMLEIQSVDCTNETTLSVVRQFFSPERFAKLKKLYIYVFYDNETGLFKLNEIDFFVIFEMEQLETVNFVMNWLTQPDTDGPKLLEFTSDHGFFEQILRAIREEFYEAQTPRTFAVHRKLYNWQGEVADFHLENGIGEELHGEWVDIEHEEVFQITRHQAARNTPEVREWIMAMTKGRKDRKIWIFDPTVGSLDAAPQMIDPLVDAEQDDQQKPGSSKDA